MSDSRGHVWKQVDVGCISYDECARCGIAEPSWDGSDCLGLRAGWATKLYRNKETGTVWRAAGRNGEGGHAQANRRLRAADR